MRKIVVLFIFTVFIAFAGQASAFTHYTQNEFMTAESLDPGMTQSGIHFTLGEHYKDYYPEVRYGLGALMEVGVKFGVVSADIDTVLGSESKLGALAGVDLKYQLIKETEGIPLDMAVDVGFDNVIISRKNSSELSFATVFSKGFPLTDRGYKFTPYGGIEMASLQGSAVPKNDTSVYFFGGLEWRLSQKFMVMLEFKGGKTDVGGIGIRFEY
jgi:hypothetical protein